MAASLGNEFRLPTPDATFSLHRPVRLLPEVEVPFTHLPHFQVPIQSGLSVPVGQYIRWQLRCVGVIQNYPTRPPKGQSGL